MKIYLDYIFLENLVINIVIIIETIIFTKSKVSTKRKIVIILLDTIISCVYVISSFNKYIFHIIFSVLILWLLFKPKNIIELIKKVICFYMLYILYLGLIISVAIILKLNLEKFLNKIVIYISSGIIFHFMCKDLWKMWKTNIKSRDLYYILDINGIKVKAFVDTGNNVKDPVTLLDVIFLDEKLKENILARQKNLQKINVEVITVNGNDKKEAYIVKDIVIYKDKKIITKLDKIILSFTLNSSTPEKYSAIIGYDTYLESIEGVVL